MKNTTGFTLKLVETGPNTGQYRSYVIAGTNTQPLSAIIGCFSTGDVIKAISTVNTSITDNCIVTNNPILPKAITNIYFMHDKNYSIFVQNATLVGGSRVYIKAVTPLSNDGNPLYMDYTTAVVKSSISDTIGITIYLYETGLHTGIYTNSVILSSSSSGVNRKISAINVGETVYVIDTISSNIDTITVANTPLGLVDDFDDGSDPNEADGNISDLNNATHSYNNTIRDYTPIVTNGYSLEINFSGTANRGVSSYLSGFEASKYSQISFARKGAVGTEDIGVRLKDRNGNSSSQIINNIGTSWSVSTFNLSSFSGISISNLYSIEFYANSSQGGPFYIDDVKFVNPVPISSVTIYSANYVSQMTNARIGDQIYIELKATITNTNTIDDTVVILKSTTDSTNGIRVILTETGRNTGIYRGTATIAQVTSDPADQIAAKAGDYVYVVAAGTTSITDRVYIIPNPLDHFEIIHDGTASVNTYERIVIIARDIYNDIVINYSGTISLYTIGETGEISWTNSPSANGSFIDGGSGNDWAKYTFNLLDYGVVTLFIKDNTAETVDPECISLVGNYTDNDIAPQLLEFIGGAPDISITKSISNVKLGGVNSTAIPGATITYKITYTNSGPGSGNQIIIYDRIPPQVTYYTQTNWTTTGWTNQFSTNINPDLSWNSLDWVNNPPASKSNIKWIRWKKLTVSPYEKGSITFKVIIK